VNVPNNWNRATDRLAALESAFHLRAPPGLCEARPTPALGEFAQRGVAGDAPGPRRPGNLLVSQRLRNPDT
jgi:hypothetical protein